MDEQWNSKVLKVFTLGQEDLSSVIMRNAFSFFMETMFIHFFLPHMNRSCIAYRW